eukprot:CAMPEP_0170158912 /NCGR_PEP_ID=MMETSP0033_2-20121228/69384_1 /TAXON_ID=195969 /ORGANISM="Dolichomastix tenuilepis, Strain CCMP3274" /LENGTH=509 /DNA_ID=CAMNT_0010396375 /DNA_START=61 /DNA_END=1586 /DNA_ORIENTATION=+
MDEFDPGWCHPALTPQGVAHRESGMWSVENTLGVELVGLDDLESLYEFAHVPTVEEAAPPPGAPCRSLESLQQLVQVEAWAPKGSVGNRESSEYLGTLRSYLNAQFLRCVDQGKVVQCFDHSGVAIWACFNTGLLSVVQEELVFAVMRRDRLSTRGTPWVLHVFCNQVRLQEAQAEWSEVEVLIDVPRPAVFLEDPLDQLWCPSVPGVTLDAETQLWGTFEQHFERFPPFLRSPGVSSQARKQAVTAAMQRAVRLAEHNPRLSVPQYVRPSPRALGTVQLLLPLKLEPETNDTHLALVVSIQKSRRGGRVYRATGLLPLERAYSNARAIMPIQEPWLKACMHSVARLPPGMMPPPGMQGQQQQQPHSAFVSKPGALTNMTPAAAMQRPSASAPVSSQAAAAAVAAAAAAAAGASGSGAARALAHENGHVRAPQPPPAVATANGNGAVEGVVAPPAAAAPGAPSIPPGVTTEMIKEDQHVRNMNILNLSPTPGGTGGASVAAAPAPAPAA